MKFSVIMPLYNKALYVQHALETIAAQTFKDFELIIVDDGSTDNSAAICEEFIKQQPTSDSSLKGEELSSIEGPVDVHRTKNGGRLHLIRQANAGVAAARNRGVAESHGEFLCFLDADDWWEPTFLEEMDKLIAEYPNAGIFCTNYIYYKPGKTHVAIKHPTGYMNYPETYLHGEMPVWTGATCMPRRVFDEMGGFPVGIKLGEDFLLWAKTAIKYKVAFCEKPLAYYNNDVPASLRATHNLHAPEYHMLFNLQPIESEIECKVESVRCKEEWKALLDKLRVVGLMDYWLDERYHDDAAKELAKVDWSKQSKTVVRQYKTPIWILRARRRFMQVGSYLKQKFIRFIYQ